MPTHWQAASIERRAVLTKIHTPRVVRLAARIGDGPQSELLPELTMATAVFIDADWLHVCALEMRIRLDFAELYKWFQKEFDGNVAVSYYVSVDQKRKDGPQKFAATLASLGYIVRQTPMMSRASGRSSSVDMLLAVEATNALQKCERIVLVSGDSDFTPLLNQAARLGKRTVLVAFPAMTSRLLIDAASRFVSIEDVIRETEPRKKEERAKPQKKKSPSHATQAAIPAVPEEVVVDKDEQLEVYLLLRKLLKAARKEVVIIDPYIDEQLFLLLKIVPQTAIIQVFTDERKAPPDTAVLAGKLRQQGWRASIFATKNAHDRFLRVDGQWWHSGHSFKDLGNKLSFINQVKTATAIQRMNQVEASMRAESQEIRLKK